MKKAISCLLAVSMAFAMAACSPDANDSSNNAQGAGTIKIGIMAPTTGDVALYGTAVVNGAELAIAEINANGGINGKQVEYKVIDEKGSVSEAVNAYQLLKDYGMNILLGDVTSKPTLAVAGLAVEDGIPMITATGTAANITLTGNNIFRTCFTDPFQGKVLAEFVAQNLKLQKVALLYNTGDDYSSGVAKSFKETAQEKGLQITAEENYGTADIDFRAQLTKIISSGAEVLVFPDYYGKASLVAAQARALGFTGPIVGPDGFDGVLDAVDANNLSVTDNMYYTNHFFDGDETPVVANFVKNYKVKYNETPVSFAALGYDAVYQIKKAIEIAGDDYTDYAALTKALSEAEIDGVTGHIVFDENGDPVKSVSVIKIQDGKQTLAAKVSAE